MSDLPFASLPHLPAPGVAMLLRALFKRAAARAATPASATYRLDRIDTDHVRRYNAAFGFPGDAVTLTYLYLLAQRAQLATMLDRPAPFRIPGLLHVENRLAMHGPIDPDRPLVLATTVAILPPAANGAVQCVLETRAFDGARLAFECDSTYLIKRGARSDKRDVPRPAPEVGQLPGQPLASWPVALDAGVRYAALSGDWNPIHLWPWSARLMGMRAPIIHGAHTLAKTCALLQADTGRELAEVWCRFRQPIALGAQAALVRGPHEADFAVLCGGRAALEGKVQLR